MQNSMYIEIPQDLTSYEFFNSIIAQTERIPYGFAGDIIMDFSKTLRVEPLVIPNLLCLGHKLNKKYKKDIYIYIPDISYSGELKNYLNEIGFTKYANRYQLYEFVSSPYNGVSGKRIDPICGTLYFDENDEIDIINRGVEKCITPFVDEYLFKFQSMRIDNIGLYYVNEIAEFLNEIIVNCKQHAKTFSFTTLHAKYSSKKIYIAISDLGYGFGNTVEEGRNIADEVNAILTGVYKRKESKTYGLYNVIRRVLEFDGKVRIHSNDAQIIFTPRILKDFKEEKLYQNLSFEKFNVKRNIPFDGVHIELELPLERRKSHV